MEEEGNKMNKISRNKLPKLNLSHNEFINLQGKFNKDNIKPHQYKSLENLDQLQQGNNLNSTYRRDSSKRSSERKIDKKMTCPTKAMSNLNVMALNKKDYSKKSTLQTVDGRFSRREIKNDAISNKINNYNNISFKDKKENKVLLKKTNFLIKKIPENLEDLRVKLLLQKSNEDNSINIKTINKVNTSKIKIFDEEQIINRNSIYVKPNIQEFKNNSKLNKKNTLNKENSIINQHLSNNSSMISNVNASYDTDSEKSKPNKNVNGLIYKSKVLNNNLDTSSNNVIPGVKVNFNKNKKQEIIFEEKDNKDVTGKEILDNLDIETVDKMIRARDFINKTFNDPGYYFAATNKANLDNEGNHVIFNKRLKGPKMDREGNVVPHSIVGSVEDFEKNSNLKIRMSKHSMLNNLTNTTSSSGFSNTIKFNSNSPSKPFNKEARIITYTQLEDILTNFQNLKNENKLKHNDFIKEVPSHIKKALLKQEHILDNYKNNTDKSLEVSKYIQNKLEKRSSSMANIFDKKKVNSYFFKKEAQKLVENNSPAFSKHMFPNEIWMTGLRLPNNYSGDYKGFFHVKNDQWQFHNEKNSSNYDYSVLPECIDENDLNKLLKNSIQGSNYSKSKILEKRKKMLYERNFSSIAFDYEKAEDKEMSSIHNDINNNLNSSIRKKSIINSNNSYQVLAEYSKHEELLLKNKEDNDKKEIYKKLSIFPNLSKNILYGKDLLNLESQEVKRLKGNKILYKHNNDYKKEMKSLEVYASDYSQIEDKKYKNIKVNKVNKVKSKMNYNSDCI